MATSLGLLRVRGAAEDTPALRLGLTSLLATGQFEPAGLPPSAILVVRRLDDPMPGRMPARRRRVAIDAAWERAVRDALGARYRRARRPLSGDVGNDADAVVFADEAEMLACLALDVLRGRASGRWWWKHVRLRVNADPSAALEQAFTANAVHVPAAFDVLDRAAALTPVVSALTPQAAIRTLVAVAAACGCEQVAAAVRQSVEAPQADGEDDTGASEGPQPALASVPAAGTGWPSVPQDEVSSGASRTSAPPRYSGRLTSRQALASVALAIHRRPASVRTPSFINSLVSAAVSARRLHASGPPQVRAGLAASRAPRPDRAAETASPPPPPQPRAVVHIDAPAAERHVLDDPPIAKSSTHPPHRVSGEAARAPDAAGGAASIVWPYDAAICTALAGALYLVNVMRSLHLPECFEHDWRLASGAGAWGTLAALAAGLLDDPSEELRADPMWSVLAALNGCDRDEEIGTACCEPERFAWPQDWQQLMEGETALTEPVVTPSTTAMKPPVRISESCRRWLSHALPLVRWRIARGFGSTQADDPHVGRMLLQHPGRVHVTSSHVDVVFPLELVSLPVRLAGLDRDPGWVPSFGRVVSFHFE